MTLPSVPAYRGLCAHHGKQMDKGGAGEPSRGPEMLCFSLTLTKKAEVTQKPQLGLLVNSSLIEISEIVLLEGPEVGFACLLVLSCGVSL